MNNLYPEIKSFLRSEGPFTVEPYASLSRDYMASFCVRASRRYLVFTGTEAECLEFAEQANIDCATWLMARGTPAEQEI